MYFYRFGYVAFERKIKKRNCETCKIRFNCLSYVSVEYLKEKIKLKKLVENSWDKATWETINKKSIDMKNLKAREYLKKWQGNR